MAHSLLRDGPDRWNTRTRNLGGLRMNVIYEGLMPVFLEEAHLKLNEMDAAYDLIREADGVGEAYEVLRRAAHTLKGNAASMGFDQIAEISGALESLVKTAIARPWRMEPAVICTFRDAVEVLRQQIHNLDTGAHAFTPSEGAFAARLRAMEKRIGGSAAESAA
jgi:chemotaxis protein histidine kinase CheA